jgi:type IV pilus assembly protein PilW
MNMPSNPSRRWARERSLGLTTRGFSLVELMVALAINMLIALTAVLLYTATNAEQRALREQVNVYENGRYALEVLGRALETAGFYPAQGAEATAQAQLNGYLNPISGSPFAYNAGLFGCDQQTFAATTSTCANHTTTTGWPRTSPDADTLVVNYFTSDAMGADFGHRTDCQGNNVALASVNSSRLGGSSTGLSGSSPAQPLFVSNRYTLIPISEQGDLSETRTYALACNGNGRATETNDYRALVSGIEQLRLRYGTFEDQSQFQPTRFSTPATVGALGSVALGPTTRAGWQRVIAVRVCMVVRGLQSSGYRSTASSTGATSRTYTLVDCDGNTLSFNDGAPRKVMNQVFAVKNQIPMTY